MKQRGRPKEKRAAGDKLMYKGLTRSQWDFLRRGFKGRGYTSAAHFLRGIVDAFIAGVERDEDVTPLSTTARGDPVAAHLPSEGD